jgi:signal recognition particle subunit SRP14
MFLVSYGEDNEEPEMQELNPSLPQNLDQAHSTTLPIIIRATNGNPKTKKGDRWVVSKQSASKRIKLSTVVNPEDLDAFYAKYAEVCKAGMGALKKRDRSKRKKKERKKKSDSKG